MSKLDTFLALDKADRLATIDPSPLVRLNRAVAVAEVVSPEAALDELGPLTDRLDGYHAFHAARADLLRRAGRTAEAGAAYDRGVALAGNSAERAYLTRRRAELSG